MFCEQQTIMNARQLFPLVRRILFHSMMGTVLGIICGGLILMTRFGGSELTDWPQTVLAKVAFLLTFGISFGVGATMTGTILLMFERA